MKTYTKAQFISYVLGWLECREHDSDQLSPNNMKSALHNALVSFDCSSDSFEDYCERQEYYANPK